MSKLSFLLLICALLNFGIILSQEINDEQKTIIPNKKIKKIPSIYSVDVSFDQGKNFLPRGLITSVKVGNERRIMFLSEEQYSEILKSPTEKKNVIQSLTKKKPSWPQKYLKMMIEQQKMNNFLVILRLTKKDESSSQKHELKSLISSCDIIGNKFSELLVLHLTNSSAQSKKDFEIMSFDYLTNLPENEDTKTPREAMLVISPFSAAATGKSSGKCEYFKIETENKKKFDKKLIQAMKTNYDEFLKSLTQKNTKGNKKINQSVKIKFFKPSDAEGVDWTRWRPKIGVEEKVEIQTEETEQKKAEEKPFYIKYWYLVAPLALILVSNLMAPPQAQEKQGGQAPAAPQK